MSLRVLLMRKANRLSKTDWDLAAQAHKLQIFTSDASSAEEFVNEVNNNKIDVIATTVPGILAIGGITPQVIEQMPATLRALCHQGAGYDCLGPVTNWTSKLPELIISHTPNAVIEATADTGLWLILGALRNFGSYSITCRQGRWNGGQDLDGEPEGSVLGILGLGGIGSVVRDKCKAALSFDKILYHNRRRVSPEIEKDSEYASFDELLAKSDVILVCVPYNSNTHHLMNAEAFKKCKDGVVLVNIARGPIVEEAALVDALHSGKVKSAGLDVYEFEPKVSQGLIDCDRAILLPHVGTHSRVARRKMELEVLQNVKALGDAKDVPNLIPELQTK